MSNTIKGKVLSPLAIDTTLTKEYACAEAKATGDAIKNVDNKFANYMPLANRPTGSYTGNGDATTRTIHTGGNGGWLGICSGSYMIGFISQNGAVFFNTTDGSVRCFPVAKAKYMSGNLTISSDDNFLNGNGSTYHYQVL